MSAEEDRVHELVSELERDTRTGDEFTLVLALRVGELKRLVKAGAVGQGVKWEAWALQNIRVSASRLYELTAIAEAPDPKKMLEFYRRKNRERQKRFLDGKTAKDPERVAVIKLIKTIDIDIVRKARKLIDHQLMQAELRSR